MNKEELLYNEIYERTKDFGRTQFVREMMRLQRENKQLKDKVNQLETNIDEAIHNIKYKENIIKSFPNSIRGIDFSDLISILERGKE